MKALGLDVGAYRLSLYSLFSTVIVAIFLYIAVRLILRATKWLLRRNTRIDQTQRRLTEILIPIALFTFGLLFGIELLGIYLTAYAVFSGASGTSIVFGLENHNRNIVHVGMIRYVPRDPGLMRHIKKKI